MTPPKARCHARVRVANDRMRTARCPNMRDPDCSGPFCAEHEAAVVHDEVVARERSSLPEQRDLEVYIEEIKR